jgi:hypothetical protein
VTTFEGTGTEEEKRARGLRAVQTIIPGLNLTPQKYEMVRSFTKRKEAISRYQRLTGKEKEAYGETMLETRITEPTATQKQLISQRQELERQFKGVTGKDIKDVKKIQDIVKLPGKGKEIFGRFQDVTEKIEAVRTGRQRETIKDIARKEMITPPGEVAAVFDKRLAASEEIRTIKGLKGSQEELLIAQSSMRRTVISLEKSFIFLANRTSKVVAPSLEKFNSMIVASTGKLEGLINWLDKKITESVNKKEAEKSNVIADTIVN